MNLPFAPPLIGNVKDGRQPSIRADVLAAYLMGFIHGMLLWLALGRF